MNTGMSNARRRLLALANLPKYRDGGPVRGPGTGTSDDVLDEVRPGSYIVPADTTEKVGPRTLRDVARNLMPEDEGGKRIPVRLSNGEYKLSPEQVHAIGVRTLDQMKDATHKPAGNAGHRSVKERLLRLADGGMVDEVTREGNSYSGGNVGGNISINGAAPGGTFSSVPGTSAPAASAAAPAPEAANVAAAPAAPQAATATTNTAPGATAAAQPAAPQGWAERNAQRSAEVSASSITNRGWGANAAQRPTVGLTTANPPQVAAPRLGTPAPAPAPVSTFGQPARPVARAPGTLPGYADGGEVDDDERRNLIAQIPTGGLTAPAADGSQGQWSNTEVGRNIVNTASALPGVAGALPAVVRTGGAISGAADVVSRLVQAGTAAVGGAALPTPAQAAPAPAASAPDVAAPAPQPVAALSSSPPYTSPRQDSSMAPSRNGGQISAQNMEAGNNLASASMDAARARLLSIGDDASAQEQRTPVIRHSGNDWAARKELENARTSAMSITANGGKFDRNKGMSPQRAEYLAILKTDQELRSSVPGLEQEGQRQRGLSVRERLLQIGENARANLSAQRADDANRISAGRLAIEQNAAGFQNRAAQRMENAQVAYEQASTPTLRAAARDRLLALAGKAHDDQWKAVALQGGTDAMGNKTESILGAVNERTGEMRRMPTGQAGADRVTTKAQFDALPKGATYTGEDGRTYRKP